MTEAQDAVQAIPESTSGEPSGWYLYGITRGTPEPARELTSSPGGETELGAPQVLTFGDLAAIVSAARLSDFAPETVAARADDPAWLEHMVRAHNEVITSVHEQTAVLPAKFGSVFAGTSDLATALESMSEALGAQLDRVQGTDEWAVHVYADPSAVERRVSSDDPGIRAVKQEMAEAKPGRAYFLQRKIADLTVEATEAAVIDLAEEAYRRLASYALDGQVAPVARSQRDTEGRAEILKAAFLVSREDVDAFLESVAGLGEHLDGVTGEYSGPWPPYSFAGESLP